ncbi:protein SENSITIVE TO UV 2 isoform X4 [Alnus glutinosa]|uniref:protein SENSITIVE TO UV 2 isoform X4 n=1 Tax=Alnus glutinosa TaxID=3517 RepID=UPI002D78E768|nr:protein SENSITIVE TO UV 2 isoform X4 [Alnus glutinosa]
MFTHQRVQTLCASTKKKKVNDCGHSGREYGVLALDHHGVPQKIQNAISSNDQAGSWVDRAMPTYKAIGVQTEGAGDPAQVILHDDPLACHALSEKLLAIWGSPGDQKHGRNLISKLLVTCQTDFHILFGFMSMNISKLTMDSLADGSSDVALKFHKHLFHTSEAAKVSHLYSILTKISNGVVQLEALFEPLLDLCSFENVVIVHRSLRILHGFLKQLLSLERKFERRDNVIVEGLCSGNNILDSHGFDRGLFSVSRNETSYAGHTPLGIRLPDAEIPNKKETWDHDVSISVSHVDWVSLVEVMHQIVTRNTEECVKLEAVSVMNLILIKSNAYMEREKFGQTKVFESLPQLLGKEAGLRVQKHAVHLLYLLLNCPKLLVTFCTGCNEGEGAVSVDDNARPQKFFKVLQGLADCVACCGNGMQELTLRKNAIIVLAFLASSGKPGFEILVSPKLYRGGNFLMLILRVLVSEIDIEAAVCAEPPEISKERTLLIREALILLNRLVSNAAYSITALRVLTNSRDMASLTIDIANRLSRKGQRHWQSDSMTRQMRESEIVNLARVFKKRVYTYLGNSIP